MDALHDAKYHKALDFTLLHPQLTLFLRHCLMPVPQLVIYEILKNILLYCCFCCYLNKSWYNNIRLDAEFETENK